MHARTWEGGNIVGWLRKLPGLRAENIWLRRIAALIYIALLVIVLAYAAILVGLYRMASA